MTHDMQDAKRNGAAVYTQHLDGTQASKASIRVKKGRFQVFIVLCNYLSSRMATYVANSA